MKKFLLTSFSVCFAIILAMAQDRVITGKVTSSDDGTSLPGVNVVVKGTTTGTTTGPDGDYQISVGADAILVFSFIGMETKEVPVGDMTKVDVVLSYDATQLSEIVVTGVAQGQSIKKTPFAITKISQDKIGTVPGIDASQSLRGKVAGIQISQTQGDGGAAVFLRGAKSVFGNISPLIVVDGFQTQLTLADLVAEDIESIEVVKGAAASSLYGSRAEGGVIQVISKKGKKNSNGAIQIQSEYGISNIQQTPELSKYHPYQVNPDGSFVLSGNTRSIDYNADGFSLNLHPYQKYYNNTDALLGNNPYYSNFVSYSNSDAKWDVYASFRDQVKGGVLDVLESNKRKTGKFQFTLRPNEKIEAGVNVQYFNNSNPSEFVTRDGQGTVFAATLQFEPFINLREKDADGDYAVLPTGFAIQNANLNNPLYEWSTRDVKSVENEFLAGANFKYHFTDKLNLELSGSITKSNKVNEDFYPVGYKTRLPSQVLNNGFYSITKDQNEAKNLNAQLNWAQTFGDFAVSATAKYIYEQYNREQNFASGYNLSASVKDLAATQSSTRVLDSYWEQTVRHNYMLSGRVWWKDKVFVDGVVRQDNSSRYGADAAKAVFYRGALGYRVTQDVNLGFVNDLKIRAAYGSAGSEPQYGAKDSRVNTAGGSILVTQNANPNLSRSVTTELEVGFDAQLWKKINVQFNYATANSDKDFILAPPFGPTTGSAFTWANLGRVTSNSIELELNGDVYQTANQNFIWNTGMTFGRVRSEIKSLGGLPEFLDQGLFWKGEGLSAYAFYGNKVIRSLDDIQTDENGVVISRLASGGLVGGTIDDLTVNELGFVVEKSKIGTANEEPIFYANAKTGNLAYLGRGEADFIMGFTNTFTLFKDISIYTLIDWKRGGLKYNTTTQYLTFDSRSGVWEDFARAGLPISFVQKVYNGNSVTDYWLEDNSFVTIREVNIGYRIPLKKLGVNKFIKGAQLNITGRNLFTFTDYTGSNVEGFTEYYPYPVYRTYSARIILNF